MPDILPRSLVSLTRRLASRQESDAVLLGRFTATKDSAAFAELVRRHGPLVLGVCRRMLGHVHDADDAFQATFLVLTRSARSVRRPEALSAWLYGTAVRVCRKARSRRGTPPPLPARTAGGDDPFAEVAWKEVRSLLDDEVGRLPAALRDPLLLCYFHGLSRDEAAEQLGWSRRTLMRRLEEARERLRRRLERRGVSTLGLGAVVLPPGGLDAVVPDALAQSAVAVGNGGPVPAGVRVLAGGTGVKALHGVAGLAMLLAVGGIGLAARIPRPTAEGPTLPAAEAPPRKEPAMAAPDPPLPAGAVHRLGSRRFRIAGRNDFLLPTPDGRFVLVHPQPRLSASAAQGLVLLDAETGLAVRTFAESRRVGKGGTYDAIRPAAFSPDGKRLYALGWDRSEKDWPRVWSNSDNPCKRVVLVWDVATGKLLAEWGLPPGGPRGCSLTGIAVSPDGRRLYVSGSLRMRVAPDGHLVGEPGLRVLDAATGRVREHWEGAGYPVGTVAGGKEIITFRRDAPVTAYDAETGQPVRTFALDGLIPSVVLSPDRKTVAAVRTAGGTGQPPCEIRLWDAVTGREVRRLTVDRALVRFGGRLAFAADGKTLYLGSGSGRILRWDLSDGRALPGWSAHRGMFADLFVRPGSRELVSAGAWDGAVRRWDPATGQCLSPTAAYVGQVAVARTPDGRGIVAVDEAGRLDVWDVATGRLTKSLATPGRQLHELLFTPDGKHLLVAAEKGPNTVWDLSTGKQVGEFTPPPKLDPKADEYYWASLAFSPDGRKLAGSRFGRGTWVWTWPERKLLWHEGKELEASCFPDDETLVGGDWHSAIELRDARTGSVKRTVASPGLTDVAYSPDRRRLVTAHLDGTWRVRDAASGDVLREGKGIDRVWSVAFSPTGWLLAVAGDRTVRVYDTATWHELARCDGHDGTVAHVFFGPDEGTLVSASGEDGTALVWSLRPPPGPAPDPARLWDDLAGDGPAVRKAVWSAAGHPDVAVKLFRQKWPVPDRRPDAAQVRKLIRDLDSPRFSDREKAEAALAKLGRATAPRLREALATSPSAEVRRRAQRLLDQWTPRPVGEYSAEEARELRAVWALELAGTPEAKRLLEAWATANVGNRLCEEAAAAARRQKR